MNFKELLENTLNENANLQESEITLGKKIYNHMSTQAGYNDSKKMHFIQDGQHVASYHADSGIVHDHVNNKSYKTKNREDAANTVALTIKQHHGGSPHPKNLIVALEHHAA